MKLDYFSLLSYEPIAITGIGSIKSPLIGDVARISYPVYNSYLTALLLDVETYYHTIDKLKESYFYGLSLIDIHSILKFKDEYQSMDSSAKDNTDFFDVMLLDSKLRANVLHALNFFIAGEVTFDAEKKAFLICSGTKDNNDRSIPKGYLTKEHYPEIVDLILQRVNMKHRESESLEPARVKNKTAARLLARIQKGNSGKKEKNDKKFEFANVISALASHHKSINMTNIWDLTIYQLYDQFSRQKLNDYYDISSMSVAAWGNSQGNFDDTQWYSIMYED